MKPHREEDAQSFLLRFWYERSEFGQGGWRGVVWLPRSEGPGWTVAGPEEAFDAIRGTLARIAPLAPRGLTESRGGEAERLPGSSSWLRQLAGLAPCRLLKRP